jgi:hypothetical protein
MPDQSSACMSASLACLAKENGLTQIDHVVLSQQAGRQGENVFVVQGALDDPAHRAAHMKTSVAAQTPVAKWLQRLEQADHSVVPGCESVRATKKAAKRPPFSPA